MSNLVGSIYDLYTEFRTNLEGPIRDLIIFKKFGFGAGNFLLRDRDRAPHVRMFYALMLQSRSKAPRDRHVLSPVSSAIVRSSDLQLRCLNIAGIVFMSRNLIFEPFFIFLAWEAISDEGLPRNCRVSHF